MSYHFPADEIEKTVPLPMEGKSVNMEVRVGVFSVLAVGLARPIWNQQLENAVEVSSPQQQARPASAGNASPRTPLPDVQVSLGTHRLAPENYSAPPGDDDESLIASALSNDPKLQAQIHFILQFLRNHSPELAEAFAKSLRAGLEIGQAPDVRDTHAPARQEEGGAGITLQVSRLEISIELEKRSSSVTLTDGSVETTETLESARITISFTSVSLQTEKADPLVLDLDGNGIHVSGLLDGKIFDINADGKLDLTNFILGGDGLLALDRNQNGKIDDGLELFGGPQGARNGFEELRKYDRNQDGVIDPEDPDYHKMSVVTTGPDQPGELQLASLAQAGVAALKLAYQEENKPLNPEVTQTQTGSFVRTNGSSGVAADLLLAYRKATH
jgi:hypothetical protein